MFLQENPALPFDVLISTYELSMFDEDFLSRFCWKYTVIDEAQRLKNSSSVSFQYLIFICHTLYNTPRYSLKFTPPVLLKIPLLWIYLLIRHLFSKSKICMHAYVYICMFILSVTCITCTIISSMEVQLALFGHSVAWMLLFCHCMGWLLSSMYNIHTSILYSLRWSNYVHLVSFIFSACFTWYWRAYPHYFSAN